MNRDQRLSRFNQLLAQRILILDGAMGTMIQTYKLEESDYRGERFKDWPRDLKGNNDLLVLTQPRIIGDIHLAYLKAGADIIETNSFNSTHYGMADYGMEDAALVYELNVTAAKIARAACDQIETDDQPRYVAGVLGPMPVTASMSRDVNDPGARVVNFDQLRVAYTNSLKGLIDGGSDFIFCCSKYSSIAYSAALALSVSKMVSTRIKSLPPSFKPFSELV